MQPRIPGRGIEGRIHELPLDSWIKHAVITLCSEFSA